MKQCAIKTLLVDNYDSFTYNLYQYLKELGGNPRVFKNDKITVSQIKKMKPTHIVISPGPGTPGRKKDFGACGKIIKKFGGQIPILGICLGHQGIVKKFGGKIVKAPYPVHGKTSSVRILFREKCLSPDLFKKIPKKINAMRYHSLIAEKQSIPKNFAITCETVKDKLVMGIQHKKYPIYGIQFHPESFETPYGKHILKNFLEVRA